MARRKKTGRGRVRDVLPTNPSNRVQKYFRGGQYRKAEKTLLRLLARAERSRSPRDLEVACLLNSLGIVFKYLAKYEEAERI